MLRERGYDVLAPNDRETKEDVLYQSQRETWYNEYGEKRCMVCGDYKDISLFSTKKGTWDGLQYTCKGCATIAATEHRMKKYDDFSLANAYFNASRARKAVVAEMIRRSDSGWYI